jgi:hypothetical protein
MAPRDPSVLDGPNFPVLKPSSASLYPKTKLIEGVAVCHEWTRRIRGRRKNATNKLDIRVGLYEILVAFDL